MLAQAIGSGPSVFTGEDIEKLFQLIATISYDKASDYSSGSALLRKNFINFVSGILFSDKLGQLDAQARILSGQLDALTKKKVFDNKIDLVQLSLIKKDILNKGAELRRQIAVDDREEFVATLIQIDTETAARVPEVKVVPDKIQAGISEFDKAKIVYAPTLFQSSPAIDLYHRALVCFQNAEWEHARNLFEAAIDAENEMAMQLKKPANQQDISLYQKYIAASCNHLAIDLFAKGNVDLAVENHRNAVKEFSKTPRTKWGDQDEQSLIIYQRNLVYVLSEKGNNEFYKNNFAEAVVCYLEAERVSHEMKKELMLKEDQTKLEAIVYKLKTARQKEPEPKPATLFTLKRKASVSDLREGRVGVVPAQPKAP